MNTSKANCLRAGFAPAKSKKPKSLFHQDYFSHSGKIENLFLIQTLKQKMPQKKYIVDLTDSERARQRFVCEGIVSALSRKKQQNRRSKIIDGEKEAYLIALACSDIKSA